MSKGGVGKGGRGKDARRGFKVGKKAVEWQSSWATIEITDDCFAQVGGGRGGAPRVLVARKDPDGSGKWEHDLYQEGPRGGRGRGAGRISTDATLWVPVLSVPVIASRA